MFIAGSLTSLAVVNLVAVELFEVEVPMARGELVPLRILRRISHLYVCIPGIPTKEVETEEFPCAGNVAALNDRAVTGAEGPGVNHESSNERHQIRTHSVSFLKLFDYVAELLSTRSASSQCGLSNMRAMSNLITWEVFHVRFQTVNRALTLNNGEGASPTYAKVPVLCAF